MPRPHYANYHTYYYCSKCFKNINFFEPIFFDTDKENSILNTNCCLDYIKIYSNQNDYKDKIEEMQQKRKEYLRRKKLERICND